MEASEANLTAPPTTDTATAEAPAEAPATPDVSEQLAALASRFDTFESRLPAQEPEAGEISEQDLIAALTEEDGEYEDEYAEADSVQEQQADTAVLDQYLHERVVGPLRAEVEQRFRAGDLAVLAERYPQLREPDTLSGIRARLEPLAERYGNRGLMTDPALVEQTLLAMQAANTAAGETPALEARGQGAHIETGTGASGSPDVSPEQEIINQILGSGGGKSVFAG